MRTKRFLAFALVLVVMGILVTGGAASADDDPSGRVARLNYSHGDISFQQAGDADWVSAVPNRPLVAGDRLWADQNSRAELHVGSTSIRMDDHTGIGFLELNDSELQLQLSQGTLILRVRHLDDDNSIEVDTPNLAFVVKRNGEYRFRVNADGNETVITVFSGRGEITGGGGRQFTVVGGQQAIFSGTDELGYDLSQIPEYDEFDNWAFNRDRREDASESANYISPETTGYEDLDDYGRWQYVASYGPVWAPAAVPVGWAPYRFGHWVWVAPWGWTWVDNEPWGFAPFHYGRWAYWGSSWVWVPGPVAIRPVYAPALVAWVGGGGFGLSANIGGGVGWIPLAPGEVFVPGYRCSRTYVNNVNITNTNVNVVRVTNVYNNYTTNNITTVNRITYVNQAAPNGVTAVSHETFVNARPVGANVVPVPHEALANARPGAVPQIAPVRQSVMGESKPVMNRPPAQVFNRNVVGTRMPSAPPTTEPHVQNPSPSGQAPEMNRRNASQPPGVQPARPAEASPARNPEEFSPPAKPQPPVERGAEQPRREVTPPPERPASNPEPFRPPVRVAPPAPAKSPQQGQEEEQKFRNWQQQRPQPNARPQQEEKPQKEKEKDKETPQKGRPPLF